MARPSLGESPTERLHIKITSDEIGAIDDWRFTNRAPSRSEAVRRLIQISLAVVEALPTLASDAAAIGKSFDLSGVLLDDAMNSDDGLASSEERWKNVAKVALACLARTAEDASKLSYEIASLSARTSELTGNASLEAALDKAGQFKTQSIAMREAIKSSDLDRIVALLKEFPE